MPRRERTFTGSSTTGTSGSISRNGTTSVVINGGNGGETINVGTLGAGGNPFPSLTINGGTGNDIVNFTGDINFNAGYSLSVNLQSGSGSHGADTITVNNNAQLLVTGTGTIDLECSRNISITGGGILQTTDGNLTLAANQQATATTGSFSGVYVDGSTSRVQVTGLGLLDRQRHRRQRPGRLPDRRGRGGRRADPPQRRPQRRQQLSASPAPVAPARGS